MSAKGFLDEEVHGEEKNQRMLTRKGPYRGEQDERDARNHKEQDL